MENTLRRIADALERLAPVPPVAPPADQAAYVWQHGGLTVAHFAPIAIDLLTGIDDQKTTLVGNTRRHAAGHAAHDALLWGSRGAGKSALVKSSIGTVRAEGKDIALVEIAAGDIATMPDLFTILGQWSRPVIVFLDDLGFDASEGGGGVAAARALRSVLDGGSAARPTNVRLYVTSNRRHIVARDMAEQDSAINVRDVVDDRMALADRFGLSVGFHVCDQATWLAMVDGYARKLGLTFDPQDAVSFATQRGARSGRIAWHYVTELAGRAGRSLSSDKD
jgi:predicted AAA+ superfamily ATPase